MRENSLLITFIFLLIFFQFLCWVVLLIAYKFFVHWGRSSVLPYYVAVIDHLYLPCRRQELVVVGSISHLQIDKKKKSCLWSLALLLLKKTCLVVSKNKVPARVQRCIGSASVEEIAEEKYILVIIITFTVWLACGFPVEEKNVPRLALHKDRLSETIKNCWKSVLHINRSQVSFPIMIEPPEEMRARNYLKTSILSGNRQMSRTT